MDEVDSPFVPMSQQQICHMLKDMNVSSNEVIEQCCQEIRWWLEAETSYSKKIDDKLIHAFLVGTSFNVNAAKDKIEHYFHLGKSRDLFFHDRDPCSPALQMSSRIVNMCILPKVTPEGYRILFSQISDPNSKAYSLIDSFKRLFAQMDLLLMKDHCCRGYVYIVSGKSAGLWHASFWTVGLVRSLFDVILKCRPEAVIAWYLMDMNILLKPVFSVTMKVLNDEMLKEKIHFNDKKSLARLIPKDILPQQYGGDGEYDFQQLNEEWHLFLERNREFFL